MVLPLPLPGCKNTKLVRTTNVRAEELDSVRFTDGMAVYAKVWRVPRGEIRARVVYVHGFSDHCNAYRTLFPALAGYGIEVTAFDKRGWGRTGAADKGNVGGTDTILDDLNAVLKHVLGEKDGLKATGPGGVSPPLFLAGHSMGGAEVLTFASVGPVVTREKIRGYLVESPLVALPPSMQQSRIKVALGRVVAKILPQMRLTNEIEPEKVSRNEDARAQFASDKLCYPECTLEGLAGMLDRAAALDRGELLAGGARSVWVGHGTADLVTDHDASRRWVERCNVSDKTFKSYDEWYHRLHAEGDKCEMVYARDIAEWMLSRTDAGVCLCAAKCPPEAEGGVEVETGNGPAAGEEARPGQVAQDVAPAGPVETGAAARATAAAEPRL